MCPVCCPEKLEMFNCIVWLTQNCLILFRINPSISNTDAAIFDGAVSHREFLGNRVRYSVDVKEHVIVVDDNYSAGRRIFEFGQKVVLGLDLRQVRMLAE